MKSKSRLLINAFAAVAALESWSVHSTETSHPARDEAFRLVEGDVVAFTGGTNTVRAVKAGHLETLLTRRFAGARPRFRDLSWEGDTVFRQATVADRWREDAFGGRPRQLKRVSATVILAQFGQLEALGRKAGLEEFVAAYERLLTRFAGQTRRSTRSSRDSMRSGERWKDHRRVSIWISRNGHRPGAAAGLPTRAGGGGIPPPGPIRYSMIRIRLPSRSNW